MNRLEVIQELAAACRQHPYVALAVVGYLSGPATTEVLSEALTYAQEVRREWVPIDGHLALVEERYGPRKPRS